MILEAGEPFWSGVAALLGYDHRQGPWERYATMSRHIRQETGLGSHHRWGATNPVS